MQLGFNKFKGKVFLEGKIDAEDLQKLQENKRTRVLSLNGLKLDNLEFLLHLKGLTDLKLYNCTIKDSGALAQFKNLKHLFINGVKKGNENFTFLNSLIHLEELSIGYAPEFYSFPDLSNCLHLKKLYLFNCNKLEDIQNVALIPSLEKFGIVLTPQKPNNLEFIMKISSIKHMSGAFGGKKIDAEFHELLAKYNIKYG